MGWNSLHFCAGSATKLPLILENANLKMDEIEYFKFINSQTNEGNSALIIAVQNGSYDSVAALVNSSLESHKLVNPYFRNNQNKNAQEFAEEYPGMTGKKILTMIREAVRKWPEMDIEDPEPIEEPPKVSLMGGVEKSVRLLVIN